MNNRGFTLLELISVIAILSIIGLISIPSINKAFKTSNADKTESLKQDIANDIEVFLETSCGSERYNELIENKKTTVLLSELVYCGLINDKIYNPNKEEYIDVNKTSVDISINELGLKEYNFNF